MDEKKTVVDANIEQHLREQNEKLIAFVVDLEIWARHHDGQVREKAIRVLRSVGAWPD